MNRVAKAYWTLQAIGWDNLPARAWQMAKRKLKLLEKRLPGGELSAAELAKQFVHSDASPRAATRERDFYSQALWLQRARSLGFVEADREEKRQAIRRVVSDADWQRTTGQEVRDLQVGRMRFFSHHVCEVGSPPNFNRDPIHGVDWPVGNHWSTYEQFNPKYADLKCVWEPSRFSWAYALGRDYLVTGNESAAETFWSYLEAWDRQNPYGLSAQWFCGQEASFRCFAWVFAACATITSKSATEERLRRLTELVWYTGRHVAENLVYARSQKNNHAISEAVCLYMIGSQFPELRSAEAWRDEGRQSLLRELDRQIYRDGSFVQHSMNYHRVMLDDLLWAAALFRAAEEPLPAALHDAIDRSGAWLAAMVDSETGVAPNYGPNDGALVLPLSTCEYNDFRPCLSAARAAVGATDELGRGPWNEMGIWLGFDVASATANAKPQSEVAPTTGQSRAFESGGYYVFRGEHSRGLTRCHSYRDRPNQCDMLHFDLTHRGVNVLRDAGTYYYYTKEAQFADWFYSTAAHNTVELDGGNQMIKGPRFLWLRWVKARCLEWRAGANSDLFVGEHYGYQRLAGRPIHRRTIARVGNCYRIDDELRGAGEHEAVLRWRLPPTEIALSSTTDGRATVRLQAGGEAWELRVEGPPGASISLERGQSSPRVEGWESRHYAARTETPVLRVAWHGRLPFRFGTQCGPASELATAFAVNGLEADRRPIGR